MAVFTMTDSQQVAVTITATDKKGNPATLPTGVTPVWSVDNPALLAVTAAAGGLSATVAAVGPEGQGTVSVKVSDASGNPIAAGSLDIDIVGGAPTTIVVTPGTPTEQP